MKYLEGEDEEEQQKGKKKVIRPWMVKVPLYASSAHMERNIV